MGGGGEATRIAKQRNERWEKNNEIKIRTTMPTVKKCRVERGSRCTRDWMSSTRGKEMTRRNGDCEYIKPGGRRGHRERTDESTRYRSSKLPGEKTLILLAKQVK